MSDRFACGIAEQMIPRYAKGRCTDAEKRFLEKHCAECIECSVRLIHEKNKQEAGESSGFDRGYAAESRDYAEYSVKVYDAGREDKPAEDSTGYRDALFPETEKFTGGGGTDARAVVIITVVIISIAVGIIAAAFAVVGSDPALHFSLEDFDPYDYDDLSDYSGPVELDKEEDHSINWKDPVLEERMREITGIRDRDIMYSDVLSITWIDLSGDTNAPDEEKISDISALAEFENLTDLELFGNRIEDISPIKELKGLNYLQLSGNRIRDLEALRDMKDLYTLILMDNRISDLGPLEDMEDLETLQLDYNNISDISPLRGLYNLNELSLSGNRISDITPLQDLEDLTWLDLSDNEIREIGILEKMTGLEELNIWGNPIEDDAILSELDAVVTY